MDARGFIEKPQKIYWKYHITAVLGLQIILAAMATPGSTNCANTPMPVPAETGRRRFEFAGRLFHADRGHDADYNYWMIFWMGMIPQHQATTGRRQPDHAQPEEGGLDVRPRQVSAEGAY